MITAADGIVVGFLLVDGFYESCNFCGFMFDRRMYILSQRFCYYGGLYLLDDLVLLNKFIGVSISVGFIVCMLIVLCLAIQWVHSPQLTHPESGPVGDRGFGGSSQLASEQNNNNNAFRLGDHTTKDR